MEQDDDTATRIAERAGIRTPPRPFFTAGPRAVGAVLPSVSRKVYRKQTPAAAQILLDWEVIVGPRVAGMTVPRRLDRGTLTIACSGATAMNLHYVGQELIGRINTHLGSPTVQALKFTQAGMPRTRQGAASVPEAAVEAEAAVAALPDGPLRSALASLGRVVIGRAKHARSSSRKT
ncbi:MAG TPA: DUF721 domain-containing protein [Rhodopila sp.]|uniref:DUF721 domain-containing protein n=1 Tax=Rhodopila sp. TaxID=2480087 RepID=UPI002B5466CC|nr:DUF721 domain-containing protein [Rhodopila sp.]HVY16067.1 DUF721 domain-containing protein [Rhodopila sp.]